MSRWRVWFENLLELIVLVLMVALAIEVLLGVTYRKLGMSLSWYDEIASVTLAWLTYYGAALAALRGAHIGVPEIVRLMPRPWRVATVYVSEGFVFAFMILLAWTGIDVLDVLATDTLVSLPTVPVSYTQSVIPIGAVLFIIAEALHFPQQLAEARAGALSVTTTGDP
ncbi:MAG TPA: TRAP transporter small permease subunit [Candidatus Methylomirabilis sp.]|nr:TRAP transporter small permease subunit [Candidatus Methylomirabilis sp.]